jgi:hypothetical protein
MVVCILFVITSTILAIKLFYHYNNDTTVGQKSEQELKLKLVEGYYDITPYEAHWDIFKCLDPKCVKEKSYKCYKWCDNWEEPGGSENCKMRCADYADEQFDSLKLNNYTFNYLLPRFDKVTILKDRNDVVEWNTMDKFAHIHNAQYSRKYNGYFNKDKSN